MQLINMRLRSLLVIIQLLILSALGLHTWIFTHLFESSERLPFSETSTESTRETTVVYSRRAPILFNCSRRYKVAFTFDDGPHPIYTSLVVNTLNRQDIKAGFFVSGTSIQSFLNFHNNLTVHTFERPRIGYLLLQDYSLLENLLQGHDMYLHGWLHEKITEMQIQTVIDNISTQLLEIGLLKGFKPIYRAPWGIGTAPGHINRKALLPQILIQMGIIPALWNVDTKDYLLNVDENKLIKNTVQMICKNRGGHILMHDNRPTTAFFLDRVIRSIRASGHTIVSPGDIDKKWNDQITINRTRKYILLLREKTRQIQNNQTIKTNNYRPVEIVLSTHQGKVEPSHCISSLARYGGSIKVSPNINNV